MRCNWSTTLNVVFHKSIPFFRPPLGNRVALRTIPSRHASSLSQSPSDTFLLSPKARRYTSSAVLSQFAVGSRGYCAVGVARAASGPPIVPDVEPESPANLLTTAQISRAASQTVRMCFTDGDIRNAFFVLNSVTLTQYRNSSLGQIPPGLRRLPSPIDFGRRVPPRLAAHCLIHGLIRLGLSKKAAKEAHSMMQSGIKFRTATIEAIIQSLTISTKSSGAPGVVAKSVLKLDVSRTPHGPEVLNLSSSMVTDQCTRIALHFLLQARKYGQQRSKRMYESLVGTCLLQGEIIVASLLFVLMVKDWQLRNAITAQVMGASVNNGQDVETRIAPRIHIPRNNPVQPPFPSLTLMNAILESITECWDDTGQQESPDAHIRFSLQALANLTTLLNDGLLPFANISNLIKAIYSCPNHKDLDIWVTDAAGRRHRNPAYSYLHGSLRRLFGNLPTGLQRVGLRKPDPPPPLTIWSCNALIHYALRHRQSFDLANRVLNYMKHRKKPLKPDDVTYNILLRSATLLRENDIAEQALNQLRRRMGPSQHDDMLLPASNESDPSETRSRSLVAYDDVAPLSSIDRSPISDGLTGEEVPKFADSRRRLDNGNYTLATYIAHLTATGRAHVVADILWQLLPELRIIDHPSWGSMSYQDSQEFLARSRLQCVQRALTYGPRFFTAILNALRRAGKTGLAERVWFLAREAERASWSPEYSQQTEPWCLPVYAYTIMLQCYSSEANKGLQMQRAPSSRLIPAEEQGGWKPSSQRAVIGWAYFILHRNKLRATDLSRSDAGREMGLLLYRSMRLGAKAVINAITRMKEETSNLGVLRKVQIPKPDARFFNAALDLFSRHPHMRVRASQTSPSHWRHMLGESHQSYMKSGKVSSGWSPALQEVVEDLVAAGYKIPPGYQHLFVGSWNPERTYANQYKLEERRPYGYPPLHTSCFSAHSIPTVKTRGLPVNKRYGRKRLARSKKQLKYLV